MHRQGHLAADAQAGLHQRIERVADDAADGILHRHHAVVGGPRFHIAEDLVDRTQRPLAHRVAEVLRHRCLRVGALRAEVGDGQRRFEREAGGHDLAHQPRDDLVGQRPAVRLLVAGDGGTQHLGFTGGAVVIAGVALLELDVRDLLRDTRALADQALDLLVQRIDGGARLGQRAAHLAAMPRTLSTPWIAAISCSITAGTAESMSTSV